MKFHHWMLIGVATLLCGCEGRMQQFGHPPLADMAAKLTPDVQTREDVLRVLGSPSTSSDFGPITWYYISAEQESVAFFKPETVRQEVLTIQFAEDGTIARIEQSTMKDGEDVRISNRETPTEGHKLGFVEQVIGNVGRFNSGTKKTGPRTLGRPGGI